MRSHVVRCPTCPDHPALDAPADVDVRKCVRCQGDHRWLPLPHPTDHLCEVCRSECPRCDAPAGPGRGGLCVACQGICRECGAPLPDRSAEPAVVTVPPVKKGGRERVFFSSTLAKTLCDNCRHGRVDRERLVVRAFPQKLLRACGGTVPHRAMQIVRAELEYLPPRRLTERVERRWWQQWANRPLNGSEADDAEAYGPDDVAVWLIVPHSCPARCEDGWLPENPDAQCPTCRPQQAHRAVVEPRTEFGNNMLAEAREALRSGKTPRLRGEYVPSRSSGGRTRYIPEES